MSAQLATLSLDPALAQGSELTAAEWCQLLGYKKQSFAGRRIPVAGQVLSNGGLTKTYRFSDLPADYQETLQALRQRQGCRTFAALLDVREVEAERWQPARELGTLASATQTLAELRKAALSIYWQTYEADPHDGRATLRTQARWLEVIGKPICARNVRRWVKAIEARGGPDNAPIEAYAGLKSEHGKCVPHPNARREEKLQIPRELIEAFKCACTKVGQEHIRNAYRETVELPWLQGLVVPGVGVRPEPGAKFPFTFAQLRDFAPSKGARQLRTQGSAAARRDSLPHGRNTRAFLHRAERLLIDDSRINIIATDDLTGRPVELRCQFLLDVGPLSRIEGFVVREVGNMRATDTDALIARALRHGCGLAAPGAGYRTTIRFERGAVACSGDRERFLLSSFPETLAIDRTRMLGGRAFAGDFQQSSSGDWMGKSHVESFMRTLAYFLQHVPGQRGGTYARQPGALGLKGRQAGTGSLLYTRGSQVHRGALTAFAERAMAVFEGDLDAKIAAWSEHGGVCGPAPEKLPHGRLKVDALYPVSWVIDAVKAFVAYYNQRTDHRIEGARRIEEICPETRKLRHRVESPDERAAWLHAHCPTERISAAACARLLLRARPVTVGKNGVTVKVAPFGDLRFWKEGSIVCGAAGLLCSGEKKLTALLDEEAIRHAQTPEELRRCELLIVGNTAEALARGEPARFWEALPLYEVPSLNDPAALARQNEMMQRERDRLAAEMVMAAGPEIVRQAGHLRSDLSALQAVVVANDGARRATAPDSSFLRVLSAAAEGGDIEPADGDAEMPGEGATPASRHDQMQDAVSAYAASLAAQFAAPSGEQH